MRSISHKGIPCDFIVGIRSATDSSVISPRGFHGARPRQSIEMSIGLRSIVFISSIFPVCFFVFFFFIVSSFSGLQIIFIGKGFILIVRTRCVAAILVPGGKTRFAIACERRRRRFLLKVQAVLAFAHLSTTIGITIHLLR